MTKSPPHNRGERGKEGPLSPSFLAVEAALRRTERLHPANPTIATAPAEHLSLSLSPSLCVCVCVNVNMNVCVCVLQGSHLCGRGRGAAGCALRARERQAGGAPQGDGSQTRSAIHPNGMRDPCPPSINSFQKEMYIVLAFSVSQTEEFASRRSAGGPTQSMATTVVYMPRLEGCMAASRFGSLSTRCNIGVS